MWAVIALDFEDNGWNFNQGMQDFKIRDYRIKDC